MVLVMLERTPGPGRFNSSRCHSIRGLIHLNVFHQTFVTGFFPCYNSRSRINVRDCIEEYLLARVGDCEGGN